MAKLTQFTGVRNDRYWHYSDPTHRMHLKWYELVPGTRSLWACVREDWANGYTQWVAIAHVSVETEDREHPLQEDVLREHFDAEGDAVEAVTRWLDRQTAMAVAA